MAPHAYASKPNQNCTILQAFEWWTEGRGKHWKKLTELAPKLAEMGITAQWIPPPTKAGSKDSVGYDPYDLYDLGEFDQKGGIPTKYGTKEELVNLVKKAKECGIITYIDAVLNHKMGADDVEKFQAREMDQDDRLKPISDAHDIEGYTAFNFPGRGEKYSKLKWNFNHFTGVDYDKATDKKGIFEILGENKTWAKHVDTEHRNYDFLMGADIDQAHGDVSKDLFQWGEWVLKETGASGFRFDAVKHIDSSFTSAFINNLREKSGEPVFAVGEFWKDSIDSIEDFLGALATQFSVFDVPLHFNFVEAGNSGSSFDLRKIWDGSVVQKKPIDAVTLVDNHDTQIGQSLSSWVSPQFKPLAYAMILLRSDGYPSVFWGDLFGCGGSNPQQPMNQLEDFIRARKYFAYGSTIDVWDYANCVAWARTGDDLHDGCVVVLCNGDKEGTKVVEIGKEHAGEVWTDVLGWHDAQIPIGKDGKAEFKCRAKSVSIWTKKDAKGREFFRH